MNNLFLECPNGIVTEELNEFLCAQDWIVQISLSDVNGIIAEATNAIVLSGKGSGINRCADAIREAERNSHNIAGEHDLFSADKAMLVICYPSDKSMLTSELQPVDTFARRFHSKTKWIYGLAEKDGISELEVTIIASNLHKS